MVPKISFAMCDVRDVAAAHITAMTSPNAPGKKINKTNDKTLKCHVNLNLNLYIIYMYQP